MQEFWIYLIHLTLNTNRNVLTVSSYNVPRHPILELLKESLKIRMKSKGVSIIVTARFSLRYWTVRRHRKKNDKHNARLTKADTTATTTESGTMTKDKILLLQVAMSKKKIFFNDTVLMECLLCGTSFSFSFIVWLSLYGFLIEVEKQPVQVAQFWVQFLKILFDSFRRLIEQFGLHTTWLLRSKSINFGAEELLAIIFLPR